MNCNTIQPRLSEYIDNALSARDTWEVDKHLADCNACTRALNEMRQTVSILTEAPRFEVSSDFMEKLHARIAVIEPEPPRVTWLASVRELFRPRVLPAWGAAMGACALALIMLMPRTPVAVGGKIFDSKPQPVSLVQTARNQNVALAATNPLGDPAAAALVASNTSENGEPSTATQ
jgi:anti-sigma factor RsiW